MNDFRTVLNSLVSSVKISLKDPVLTIGSCFSNAIGDLLTAYKVNTCVNPFGTIYNPHAIHKALQYCIENGIVPQNTFVQHHEVYLNYDFHSELSSLDLKGLTSILRQRIEETNAFFRNTRWLMITYGTAWAYARKDTGAIVANCHKQPASHFTKFLLTPEKIIASFDDVYKQIKTHNPAINIILTVSPVRHIKETLEGNSISKSVLRLATHTLSSRYADVHYFPAYEIMMDDLRDYRFYQPDMLHPTKEAEVYIWKKFIASFANEEFQKFINSWDEILTAINHKPFHPSTMEHQRFLLRTLEKLKNLEPMINVDFEKGLVQNNLINRN